MMRRTEMLRAICLLAGLLLGTLAAGHAAACTFSNVQPGMSTTASIVRVKAGNSCSISMDLEGWEIHRISVVEKPRFGIVQVRGNRGYVYSASKTQGVDRFVMEFETTGVDWLSGARLQRTTWRLTLPVEVP
jgi:hypothetical protein